MRGGFEGVECLADSGLVAQVHLGQVAADEVAVLGGHTGAVPGVRGRGVSGVANESGAALGPLLQRLAVADQARLARPSRALLDGDGIHR